MKIALYVPSWPPGNVANGIVTYASQLVPALRKLGHDVFILTPYKQVDDHDPYIVDLKKYGSPRTIWNRGMYKLTPEHVRFEAMSSIIVSAVKELVEKYKLEVFEIEESFGWSFSVSRLKLLPVVVRLHGPWFLNGQVTGPGYKTTLNGRQKREGRGIQHAQLVTAPSVDVLNAVKAHYNLSLSSSLVIANSLEAAPEAELWDIKSCDKEKFLFVGRFDEQKGGDLVLHAFAKLARSRPKLRLTFVGTDKGVEGSDGTTLQFQQYVQKYLPDWCRSRIEFCGEMNHSDVMAIRSKHFATIIASRYEPFGYTVLEAMSLGCPIVAANVGGIPELIKDRYSGLLVPPGDSPSIASACEELLDDQSLAVSLARQAWQDCSNFYEPERLAKKTAAAYRQAINEFKSSSSK